MAFRATWEPAQAINAGMTQSLAAQLMELGGRLGMGWKDTLQYVGQVFGQAKREQQALERLAKAENNRQIEQLAKGVEGAADKVASGIVGAADVKRENAQRDEDLALRQQQLDDLADYRSSTLDLQQQQLDLGGDRLKEIGRYHRAETGRKGREALLKLVGGAGAGVKDLLQRGAKGMLDYQKHREKMLLDRHKGLGAEIRRLEDKLDKPVRIGADYRRNEDLGLLEETARFGSPYTTEKQDDFQGRIRQLTTERAGIDRLLNSAGGGEQLASRDRLSETRWRGFGMAPADVRRLEVASGLSESKLNDLMAGLETRGLSQGALRSVILRTYLAELEREAAMATVGN